MPSALDRLVPEAPAGRRASPVVKRKPRGRSRVSSKGATRNVSRVSRSPRPPSIWLNRVLILLGAGIVIAAAGRAYITLDRLPVQRISVTGQLEHTQADAVQEMVHASLGGGFLSADLQRMREQLEGLPWIFEATVRRRWPNALEIHVVEQLPIARWGADSFLNHEGGVFRSGKERDGEALPQLRGPEDSAAALMAKYQRLVEILAPLQLSVEQLTVDERGQVEAVLGGGIRLAIGSRDYRERMQRFVTIYRNELAPRTAEIERVDLRYTTGVAVAFREAEASQVAGL